MDQQKQTPEPRVPTEAEIARLEAEAAAALREGEPAARPQAPSPESDRAEQSPAQREFVPYVDDVPEPGPGESADGDAEEEYIPGKWERRIDALTPQQWKRWQIAGGAVVGLAALASLFVFGDELSAYGLIVAALLALLLPRYLERAWRRKLITARYAMVAAMVAGLAVLGIIAALRGKL